MKTKRNAPARPYKSKYSAQNKSYGAGGAVMTLVKNLLDGKKLGDGALKGVFQAGLTPGSGWGAGMKLAGTGLSKWGEKTGREGWQKFGEGVDTAGNFAGLFTGGGGGEGSGEGMQKILETLKSSQGANGMRVTKSFNQGGNVTPWMGGVPPPQAAPQAAPQVATPAPSNINPATGKADKVEVRGMGGYDEAIMDSGGDQAANTITNAIPAAALFKAIGEGGSKMIVGDSTGEERKKKQKVAAWAFSPHKLIAMRKADRAEKGKGRAENGIKVPAAGGMKVLKSYENGGAIGDPIKPTEQAVATEGQETYGTPRVIKTTTASGDYQTDKPLTGGDYQPGGTIGAVNPQGGSLDSLDDEKRSGILKSEFGQRYLSGEGSLDSQYKDYTIKVNNFIDNDPKQALAKINAMIQTNPGFEAKLKGKSDKEKLSITRTLMTDGKIGDFHGTILTGQTKTPLSQFYTPKTANIRGPQGTSILIASGMRGLKENQMEDYLAAAETAGISREDLSQDTDRTRDFLNQYLDENGFRQSSPSAPDETGSGEAGYNEHFINKAKDDAKEHLDSRADQAKEKSTEIGMSLNKQYADLQKWNEERTAYNETHGTDFRNMIDVKADKEERSKQDYQNRKEENMATITEEQKPAFMDEYFKSMGITNPTLKQREDADIAYEKNPDKFKSERVDLGSFSFGGGGRMRVLKNGGRLGALDSLMR
tara:strand:- start:544 stop:2664 length:2121 start_codon:yes stop_codon:yes gene_type:complete